MLRVKAGVWLVGAFSATGHSEHRLWGIISYGLETELTHIADVCLLRKVTMRTRVHSSYRDTTCGLQEL